MYFNHVTILKLIQTVSVFSSLRSVSGKKLLDIEKGNGNGNNGGGNGNGGGGDVVMTGEVKCVPYQVEALMASDVLGGPDDENDDAVEAPTDDL